MGGEVGGWKEGKEGKEGKGEEEEEGVFSVLRPKTRPSTRWNWVASGPTARRTGETAKG